MARVMVWQPFLDSLLTAIRAERTLRRVKHNIRNCAVTKGELTRAHNGNVKARRQLELTAERTITIVCYGKRKRAKKSTR